MGSGSAVPVGQRDVLGVAQLAVGLRPALAVAADLGVRVALAEGGEDRLLDRRGDLHAGAPWRPAVRSASNTARSM